MANYFYGSVHPDDKKTATRKKPAETLPPPAQVIIPLEACPGDACFPLVRAGDKVRLGQKIGETEDPAAVPVHASVSGIVSAVEPRPHPCGRDVLSVVIDNDFNDTLTGTVKPNDINDLTPEDFVAVIRECGVVGMKSGVPAHEKITSGLGKVSLIIVNGAECEPYLTSDHRAMLEQHEQIIGGLRLLMDVYGAPKAVIAIESGMHNAVRIMRKSFPARNSDIRVLSLSARYPQGAEKQIVQDVTGREVPPGEGPESVGCAVFNVATVAAVFNAVYKGMPLIDRIVTVSGSAISNPKNLRVRIGTPIQALIDAAGGFKERPQKVIVGGPMMGQAQADLAAPVLRTAGGVLAFCENEHVSDVETVCLRCGKCVYACPMQLLPIYMYKGVKKGSFSELENLNIGDCIECGCCSYICPARLPLASSFKSAKVMLVGEKAV